MAELKLLVWFAASILTSDILLGCTGSRMDSPRPVDAERDRPTVIERRSAPRLLPADVTLDLGIDTWMHERASFAGSVAAR